MTTHWVEMFQLIANRCVSIDNNFHYTICKLFTFKEFPFKNESEFMEMYDKYTQMCFVIFNKARIFKATVDGFTNISAYNFVIDQHNVDSANIIFSPKEATEEFFDCGYTVGEIGLYKAFQCGLVIAITKRYEWTENPKFNGIFDKIYRTFMTRIQNEVNNDLATLSSATTEVLNNFKDDTNIDCLSFDVFLDKNANK